MKSFLNGILGFILSAIQSVTTMAERLAASLHNTTIAATNHALQRYYYLWASRTLSAVGVSVPSYHSGVSVGSVILVVVAAISLSLGIFLVGTFQTTLDTSGLSAPAINAIGKVYANTYSALQLLGVGLIVLAVVSILGLLINAFTPRSQGA